MTIQEIRELAAHAAKRTAPENYSVETVDKALCSALNSLAGNVNDFMKNRYDIYSILTEQADEIVPARVSDALGIFAEVRVVPDNTKVAFKRSVGKTRAKQFITKVGVSGVYETFRLDTQSFEVPTSAHGGAGIIDFQRMLDGAETLSDVLEIMNDGLTDAAFGEVQTALRSALNSTARPAANMYTGSTFTASEMVKLMNVVRAYGDGVVIFAPPEFISAMGPDAIVPVGTNYQGVYHPQDLDRIHNQGFINIFRGAIVVQLPQSFVDEKNEKTQIDPQLAYIFPTGKERIVKLVIEGPTQVVDFVNRDNSMEIHFWRKLGAAIITHNNWAIYKNTGITQTYTED